MSIYYLVITDKKVEPSELERAIAIDNVQVKLNSTDGADVAVFDCKVTMPTDIYGDALLVIVYGSCAFIPGGVRVMPFDPSLSIYDLGQLIHKEMILEPSSEE